MEILNLIRKNIKFDKKFTEKIIYFIKIKTAAKSI